MNTLLGELATYNDIQYPRYRFAFKLRRLQTTFILHHFDLAVLQDIFHSTGLQPLSTDHEVTEKQLDAVLAEIFASLKATSRIEPSVLHDAHTTCFNWFMMALQCGTSDSRATAGVLKIILSLFCKGKTVDKAKYIFSVLVHEGTVGLPRLQFFCETIQLLANCIQETIYPDVKSVDQAMSECLYYVRDKDDIEDEEEDGGLKRPWLSVFELVKAFTASPPLNFLTWMDLWFSLTEIEKVVHTVKCNICGKRSIKGFRYQCEECQNFNMCQMCFLKGRVAENHKVDHKVLECQDYTKSFKSRIRLSTINSKIFRIMDEPRDQTARVRYHSKDLIDGLGSPRLGQPVENIPIRSPSNTPEVSHRPTTIRIGGSKESINSAKNSFRRHSVASTSSSESCEGRIAVVSPTIGSPASLGSPFRSGSIGSPSGSMGRSLTSPTVPNGIRKPPPIIPSLSSRRYTDSGTVPHRSLQRIADEEGVWGKKVNPITKTRSDGNIKVDKKLRNEINNEYNKINKKLSLEVDRLLQDIEPLIQDASSEPLIQDASSVPTGIKMSISSEESNEDMSSFDDDEELQTRLDEAEKRKDSLAMELETFIDQIKQLHSGFQGLKEGNRLSPLTHHVIYTENNNENGQRSTSLDDCITHRRNDTLNQRHNAGRLSTVW